MSIIAYRGGVLAADTGAFAGQLRMGKVTKIWRIGDRLCGSIGSCADDEAFLEWMRGGPRPENLSESFDGLLVLRSGLVQIVFPPRAATAVIDAPFFAIGCGADVALGAMEIGATAAQAVAAACRINVYCSAPVDILRLDGKSCPS